ncbi:MAG: YfcE family phosphodiesterase [Treponema sp.]|nr:YfcE family phosphodiesterase [Treponema sp.]
MIELIQQQSHIIGSQQDIEELANKKQATIIAISDSHGRTDAIKYIIDYFGSDADLITFSGDGIGDIVTILENTLKNRKLSDKIPAVCAMVSGNGDDSEYNVDFNPRPDRKEDPNGYYEIKIPHLCKVKAAGMNIILTHGHQYGVYYGVDELERETEVFQPDLVLYGHTHVADRKDKIATSFINPGSCALPRRGLPPSCAIIKIPGDQERITCTFYEMKVTLTEGVFFVPFDPTSRNHY